MLKKFQDDQPHIMAVVDLEEGVRMLSNSLPLRQESSFVSRHFDATGNNRFIYECRGEEKWQLNMRESLLRGK